MYTSLEELCEMERKTKRSFWKIVQEDDCRERAITDAESFAQMRAMYQTMRRTDEQYDEDLRSASGLVGTEGAKMAAARKAGNLLCGNFIGKVMEKALKTSESNACMKRIVAAPTAGSCGVVPAVFLTMQEEMGFTEDLMVEALYVAAGIGGVIASRAFLSGAAGGCQAEIGSASAMAAGGAVYLQGGNAEKIANAAALALKNLLGLACDPVAGLVEVPCVKRNVLGAVNAMTAADMTMAGIYTKIPPDEVIDAMRSIGRSMHEDIRETGKGGLAGTSTGAQIRERMSGEM
ncbi:MAG: L-serine ammonia-lyase, iron-sulfur-dependent, subunit alpha [Clostridiales bacterium]|nr:L-serine ammonia-lyase, iron-sulfur-dependent, subunit alpha [Clostridiales bacterium]